MEKKRLLLAIYLSGVLSVLCAQSWQVYMDSLEKRIKDPISDTLKLQYYLDLAHLNMNIDPGRLMGYADSAFSMATKLNFELEKGFVYNYKATYYANVGDYQQALQNFLAGLNVMEQVGHQQGIAEGQMNVGLVYSILENYEGAEKYLLQALVKAKEINSETSLLLILNNLGNLYTKQDRLDEALSSYKEGLALASDYQEKASDEVRKDAYVEQMVYFHKSMADTYMLQGDEQNGLDQLARVLALSRKMGNKRLASHALISLGQFHKRNGDSTDAIMYLNEGLEMASEIGDKSTLSLGYLLLSEIYEGQGDFEQALLLKEKYDLERDTLNKSLLQASGELLDYEIGKKEEDLQEAIGEKNTSVWVGSLTAAALLVLGVYLYIRKRKLAVEKKQIIFENSILDQTNLDLKERIALLSKELNAKRASDIFDEEERKKYRTSSLTDIEREEYMDRILDHMEQEKPYLDSELTLGKLAEDLRLMPYHLSEVLNETLGKNFYDFINIYRVEMVKNYIADPKKSHLTLLAIAFDAGFNSKTAFNRAFKKATGLSPSKYRVQHVEDALVSES